MPLSSFPSLQVVIQTLNSSTEFFVAFSGNLLTVANFLFTTVFDFPVIRHKFVLISQGNLFSQFSLS